MKKTFQSEKTENQTENRQACREEDSPEKVFGMTIRNKVLRELLGWLEVILCAAVLALFINNVIIANSTVPTGSMETTIMTGDRVIGSRLHYLFGEPERGDVVIFKFGWMCGHCKKGMGEGGAPEVCPQCGKEIRHPKTLYYVKRLIGLPGDKVEIRAEGSAVPSELVSIEVPASMANERLATAKVYVNGQPLEEPYLREPMLYTGDMTFEVPAGEYFFLGDNRNNSLDARFWNDHFIDKDKIIAKVLFRYFPKPSKIR